MDIGFEKQCSLRSPCTQSEYSRSLLHLFSQFYEPLFHLLQQLITFTEGKAHIPMSNMRMFVTVKCLWRDTGHTDFFCQVARKFKWRPIKHIRVIRHHKVGSLRSEVFQPSTGERGQH